MITATKQEEILSLLDAILAKTADGDASLSAAMQLIADQLPCYNWVGIYLLQGEELILGPYVGAATEHTVIPVGQGVCGTAVATNTNQVVVDVRLRDNYLACSLETRSEIVVLIRDPQTGEILGQIDADGHTVGAFDTSDEALLEAFAVRLAPRLSRKVESL